MVSTFTLLFIFLSIKHTWIVTEMLKAVKRTIEQQLKCVEEQLDSWKYKHQLLESQLQAQDDLQIEIQARQVYVEEGNSLQSELLEAVKMEVDQIQAKIKEIALHIQESQQKKENFIQHVEWIQNLDQQLANGMGGINNYYIVNSIVTGVHDNEEEEGKGRSVNHPSKWLKFRFFAW